MKEDDAREFSESFGMIGAGWWRQIAWATQQGIPAALGMDTGEWVERYVGGWVKLAIEDRREAVAELAAENPDWSNQQIADVLGVSHDTVNRDLKADADASEPEPAPDQSDAPADADASEPEPAQVTLLDVLKASVAQEADEELAELVTTDDDRARDAWRRAIGEITTAQSRIVDWHERWTPEQRRELAAALTLARRDLHVEPSKLEVVR
jgi:DNA-binding transcriptional MocR family regulator